MKLKTTEVNGKSYAEVDANGLPIYVHNDGKEVGFDAAQAVGKISSLNAEAKTHREAKEAAEKSLKAFEGLDADKAEKNCPGLHAFLDNGGAPWYSDLINDPFSIGKRLSEIVYTERIAYTFYDTREVPDRISYAIDLAMWFIILFSIVSSLLLFNKHWIMRNIILFCAVGYAIALWAVDGQEVWRHMLPCLIFIPFHYLGYLSKKVVIE